ncbi:MAG: peptidylprolyl isomerase [Myxococcota bacterium]
MQRRILVLSAISGLLAATLALVGAPLGAQPPAIPGQPAEPFRPPNPEDLTPEERTRRAKVIAKISFADDHPAAEISVGELEDAINAQSPFLRARYENPAEVESFLQNLIRVELLAAEAERRRFDEHAHVVKSVKQNSVQQLIRTEFDERITPESIPEDDIRGYYNEHLDEFSREEVVRANHILLDDESEARELIRELQTADTASFRQIARQRSIDTETKLRGGDLRYFNQRGEGINADDATVDEAIVAAAFALEEIGDVTSAPVPVGSNFSVVKLTGRRPAEERTFEESSQGIRLRLWRERRQQAIEDFVAGLRESLSPQTHPERMDSIRLTVGTPDDREGFGPHGGQNAPENRGSPAVPSPADPVVPE